MATVFRKTYTQHLPKHAEMVQRHGRTMVTWLDRRGRRQYDNATLGHNGVLKIIRQSPTYLARYRDADGIERTVSTGWRDERAARHILADILRRVEHLKSGILTPQQAHLADHANRPLNDHLAEYLDQLAVKTVGGRRVSVKHHHNVQRYLQKMIAECHLWFLRDITLEPLQKWMIRQEKSGMAARTRNIYRSTMVAFCRWCVDSDRLNSHPLARLPKAEERSDRRRIRRALTEDEVVRLLKAARLRPLAEFGRLTHPLPEPEKKGRRTWTKHALTFEQLDDAYRRGLETLMNSPRQLADGERLGRERALMYKMMILTGLRKGELASLTISRLYLDTPYPYAELLAKDDKSGRGANIPLRTDVVNELKDYLADQAQDPLSLPRQQIPRATDRPLFRVPRDFIKIFDRDLAAAGIAKRDDRGRTVDLHALRHSSIELTMTIYTDPTLLDVAGAIQALPAFCNHSPHL